MAIVTMEDK